MSITISDRDTDLLIARGDTLDRILSEVQSGQYSGPEDEWEESDWYDSGC